MATGTQRKLTARQQEFLRLFLTGPKGVRGNQTKSAEAAGLAGPYGRRLMRHPLVRQAIDAARGSVQQLLTTHLAELERWNQVRHTSLIYFIRRADTREIKIGLSWNPPGRLASLQRNHGEPLELVLVLVGDKRAEAELHRMFSRHHKNGEWFHEAEEITGFIDQHLASEA